jgi:flagellar biosynthesis protein FliR
MGEGLSANQIDFMNFWAWFLLYVRLTGLFTVLPGIGNDEIPLPFRAMFVFTLSICVALRGLVAPEPDSLIEGIFLIGVEYMYGYIIGVLPALCLSAVLVSGHVVAGAMGLGQASMIDPSLGESVATVGRLQGLVATSIYLAADGHHAFIKAATSFAGGSALGAFRPDASFLDFFIDRFVEAFALSLTLGAPILIALLITQFVLGLITKFVPQVNVFIMSLPLTIAMGLFLMGTTLPNLSKKVLEGIDRASQSAFELGELRK